MKLFQSLLVAPAALGLITPLAVNASETNLNDISNYSDVNTIEFANSFGENEASDKQLIAGGEGLVSESSYDGGFSETTTASFSTNMYLGSVDGGTLNTDDPVMAAYSFQIDLSTSFTGEDSLDIAIDAGNSGVAGTVEFDGNANGDTLQVDGISYTFPVGTSITAFVGDNVDGSLLFNTACVYGGPSNTLDDCGNNYSSINAGGGTAFGASYDQGNGFTYAIGLTTEGSNADGIFTAEGDDAYAAQIAYAGNQYGVSFTYADKENPTFTRAVTDTKVWALNGYYTPDSETLPSISAGYESAESNIPGLDPIDTDSSAWFVGLQWDELAPGTFGVALGTKQHTVDSDLLDDELLMYEAFYTYEINDGMSITPLIYTKEFASPTDDETGVMVKTSFSF